MRGNWIMRAFELLDTANSLFCHGDDKPLNTRTRKTVWEKPSRKYTSAEVLAMLDEIDPGKEIHKS